jgi:hypothetical protein
MNFQLNVSGFKDIKLLSHGHWGAEQPKQAVCVYHKPLEIVEIPFYLKEPVPEYFQDTIMILVMKRFYML